MEFERGDLVKAHRNGPIGMVMERLPSWNSSNVRYDGSNIYKVIMFRHFGVSRELWSSRHIIKL